LVAPGTVSWSRGFTGNRGPHHGQLVAQTYIIPIYLTYRYPGRTVYNPRLEAEFTGKWRLEKMHGRGEQDRSGRNWFREHLERRNQALGYPTSLTGRKRVLRPSNAIPVLFRRKADRSEIGDQAHEVADRIGKGQHLALGIDGILQVSESSHFPGVRGVVCGRSHEFQGLQQCRKSAGKSLSIPANPCKMWERWNVISACLGKHLPEKKA
jgi:hypothetical protein